MSPVLSKICSPWDQQSEHVSGAERKVLPLRIKPDFLTSAHRSVSAPLTPVINSVASSGLLGLRVALFMAIVLVLIYYSVLSHIDYHLPGLYYVKCIHV